MAAVIDLVAIGLAACDLPVRSSPTRYRRDVLGLRLALLAVLLLAILIGPVPSLHPMLVAAAPVDHHASASARKVDRPGQLAQVRYIEHGLAVQPPQRKMHRDKVKERLFNRYFLRTQAKERASIRFRDGTFLQLNQRTDAVLQSPHVTYVKRGEVDEILTPGTNHRIQTATAVAAAIGTEFDVRVARDKTRFVVVRGVVRVQNKHGKVEVRRNEMTVVAPNKKPTKPVPVPADQAVGWTKGMPKGNLAENIALDSNGGRVVGVSSEAVPGAAKNINDGLLETAWTTAQGQVTDQWVKIGFAREELYLISAVIIDPAAGRGASSGEDLKDFEIRVSATDTDDASFYTVLSGTAAQKNALQRFDLPPNVKAKYIELVAKTNYGSPDRVGVAELEVVGTLATTPLFREPVGVTTDAQGNVFVADERANRIVKLASNGKTLASLGKQGTGPGEFKSPYDVKVDAQGNIYVMETDNYRVQKLSPTGQPVLQWGSQGKGPGQFAAHTHHIGLDSQGNVYVADYFNDRIQKVSSTGQVLGIFESKNFKWGAPEDVAVDAQGNMYVADAFNSHIRKLSPSGELLATYGSFGTDGPGGVALDQAGNIYVADTYRHQIVKLSPAGQTLAVWGGKEGAQPGRFSYPTGLSVDASGNVYVADPLNDRIQKLSPTGAVLAIWQ